MIQKPYLFNLHNIHPSTGEFPHAFAKRKRLSQILDPIFRGFRSRGCMSFAPLVGKEVLVFCLSLDIQSYLLWCGVFSVYFADPNTFSRSVWMFREKEKNKPRRTKTSIFMLRKKSWMEFSLFPLNPWTLFQKTTCFTGWVAWPTNPKRSMSGYTYIYHQFLGQM